MMVFQTADPFENIQTIVEFLHSDRDSRFPLCMTTQALTMDDFEFQIIMDEEEGRELEDEEYSNPPVSDVLAWLGLEATGFGLALGGFGFSNPQAKP